MVLAQPIYVPAYAKVNLTLDVLSKREDGYHSLASVMQTVELHDTIALRPRPDGTNTCTCDVAELQTADNLALRAAQLLRAETGDRLPGLEIELHKEIPAQAGMGGGSSDAACVLAALNARYDLGLSLQKLESLAARLGSDVPFLVRGGTALIQGRGEHVTHLPDAEPLWLVLAKPAVNVPTPAVFRALTPADFTGDHHTAAVVTAIEHQQPLPFEHLTNALESGVMRTFPEIAAMRDALLRAGAPLVRMSGSGPTLYAPFRQLSDAAAVFAQVRQNSPFVWLTHTVPAAWVARTRPESTPGAQRATP